MFKLTIAQAEIEHLNVRKEGEEDDRELAIDVKASGAADAAVLNRLLGVAQDESIEHTFWDKDQRTKLLGLGECAVQGKVQNCNVQIGGLHIAGCAVGKFRFEVLDQHRIHLTCSISRTSPAAGVTEKLAGYTREQVLLIIEGPPELDLDNTAAGKKRAAASAPPERVVVNIDMDRLCDECKKPGATATGICLACSAKAMHGDAMKSKTGRAVGKKLNAVRKRLRT